MKSVARRSYKAIKLIKVKTRCLKDAISQIHVNFYQRVGCKPNLFFTLVL